MNRRILAAAALATATFAAVRAAATRSAKTDTAPDAGTAPGRADGRVGPRVKFGDDGMRAYEAVVSFRSNGDEFATDTVKVRAKDNLSARVAAIQAAEDSRFYDVRVPDLSRKVLSCKLVR